MGEDGSLIQGDESLVCNGKKGLSVLWQGGHGELLSRKAESVLAALLKNRSMDARPETQGKRRNEIERLKKNREPRVPRGRKAYEKRKTN